HPSAGRVPTTLGYRIYVDNLMKRARLSRMEKSAILDTIQRTSEEFDDVLKEVTRILAHLSRQLSVITSPRLTEAIFEKMEIVHLTTNRILVVLSVDSGFVKTITFEIDSSVSREKAQLISQILNERLSGMRIGDIRSNFAHIVRDIQNEETGLVRLFLRRADRLFDFGEEMEVYVMGTHNILEKPDFSTMESVSAVVEVLETPEVVLHIFNDDTPEESISIKIGEEIGEQRMRACSIIAARYKVGTTAGLLGIIGPTRMNYSKLVSLVDFTAQTLSSIHGQN
ncbi:MAG: heat-inducible transcription repressor HrcA, partial [Calditrichaeota bacterium]